MKKLFTLLTLALMSIGTAWAGDVFTVKFQNSKEVTQSTADFFTYDKGEGTAVSWSSKGKHSCTYGGDTYSDVIKMENATQCYFTSAAEATVTIVQTISNGAGDKLKFDGTNLNSDMANTTVTVNSTDKYNEYVITNVAAGKHIITRQSETGLAYVKVEYTGSVMTQLSTPEISVNNSNGEVTIGSVDNASKITYTTDGSDPTDESDVYSAAFTVEDGVTVKAIAIGDGESYINSAIATKVAYLDGIAVAEPVINQYNGTVALTCATLGATIEYSLDGETYNTYSRAFTLNDDATVYARAKRENCTTSDIASAAVTTISKGAATKTIWMGYGSFDNNTTNSMTGSVGDDAEGIVLTITSNASKNWSSGLYKINIGGTERTAIKLSNGAQNTLTLPSGMKATRITFYSFINAATSGTSSYWKEFNGENISGANVPMGAWNDVADYLTTPDVRVFPLNGDETSITFNNAGEQLCFIIALDVIDGDPTTVPVTISSAGYATFSNASEVTVPEGVTAYTAVVKDASTISLLPIDGGVIPAGEGVVLKADAGNYDLNITTTGAAKIEGNLLKAQLTNGTPEDASYYTLAAGPTFKKSSGGTLAAGKAYLVLPAAESRGSFNVTFGDATGISEVNAAQEDGALYNLNGIRVAKATKGLYVQNGKKVIVK